MRWKWGYKKILQKHIIALYELQSCLQLRDEHLVYKFIQKFFKICDENYEIGKFYSLYDKNIDGLYIGENDVLINKLMSELFDELLKEIHKMCIHKRKVYDLLCALHNLPRFYFEKESLYKLGQCAISHNDAITYSLNNMNDKVKRR